MTTCPRCGAAIPDGARFCPACGLGLQAGPREERRVVTVLFADLVEFTAFSEARDPEEVKRIIDRAFEGLAETVTLYGGMVDKILGDEIMAVFGAPQAHEDDPERAVRCALEMQRALARYSDELAESRGVELKMRIGINTGEVVAGAIGGGDAYTVVGDAVNVASRVVKAAAPGAVLMGASTRAATGDRIVYREHPPLTVKGKAEALVVYEATGERAQPAAGATREVPLIGRDIELSLMSAVAGLVARDRRPAAIAIVGDGGMGKTRLAAEFASRLPDARVLWGRSLPYGTTTASYAMEEIVRAAFGIGQAEDAAAARKRIADQIEAIGLSDVDKVAMLAGVRDHPAPAAARRTGGGAGPAAGSAPRGGEAGEWAWLFEALAKPQRLLVLVFQELHWADPSVAAAVGGLLERVQDVPLLIVALGRPELAERIAAWPRTPGSTMVRLQPLSRDASAELLDALSDGDLPASVREHVLDRAGGNPFFIEEFVRLSVERGGGETVSVPVSVQGVVAARLDMLDAPVRAVAQDAAVVGEEFWPEALAAIDGVDPDTLRVALAALTRRDLIEPVAQPRLPGRDEFRFRQTIVREVAYAALPKQARAARHASAAAWLERVTADAGSETDFTDLIAFHYERAALSARDVGLDDSAYGAKAREYLERAGDAAMGIDAAAAAGSLYERALAFARDDADALHLRVNLGEAYVGSWNPVAAEQHLERALADAKALHDRRLEGKSLRLLGDLARIRGDHALARPRLEEALQIARQTGDALEEAEGLRSHGLLDMFNGRVLAAPMWFRQALARSRDLGDVRGVGWSLQNLGWANLLLGRIDEAIAALDEGAEVFGRINDIEGAGWCLGLRSWALLFQGRLADADVLAAQLIELAAGAENNPAGMGGMGIQVERVLRAIVAAYDARLSEAVTLASSTFERFADVESEWGLAMARYPIAVAHMLRMELAEAGAVLAEADAHAAAAGDPLVQGLVRMLQAFVAIEAGELEAAQQFSAEAKQVTESAGVAWHTLVPERWIAAEIARRRGDAAGALAIVDDPEPLPATGLFPRGRLTALRADILCDLGRAAEGVEVARAARQEAAAFRVDAIAARRIVARALLESGDVAAALEEIDGVPADLAGLEWDVERVRALAWKARILDEAGRHDDAGEAFDRARALLSGLPDGVEVRPLAALLAR